MKGILENKWTKILVSAMSGIYAYFIIWMAVNSFLYRCVVTSKIEFGFYYIIINLIFLLLMLYCRKQIVTSVISLCLLPIVLVILLMNLNNLIVFIPPFVVCVTMFFACNGHETLKTILGAVYILMYVLGVIAFLVIKLLFGSSVEETRLNIDSLSDKEISSLYSSSTIDTLSNDYVSPDGKYRFFAVDVKDKALGRVDVYIEPNDKDKVYSSYKFVDAGCKRRISYHADRGDNSVPQIKWISNDTVQYQYVDGNVETTKTLELKKDYFWFLYE